MKNNNKYFSVSTKGMEPGSVKFDFRKSRGSHGEGIAAVNEIRYSVTVGKDRVWIFLPPSMLLSFIADGFETDLLTCFQHRVSTSEKGTTEWGESGEIEVLVNCEE